MKNQKRARKPDLTAYLYLDEDDDTLDPPEDWSDEDLEVATDVHSSSRWPTHPVLSHDALFRLLEMGVYAR
jgi:hypothetical protein